jgi:hypothetical protein
MQPAAEVIPASLSKLQNHTACLMQLGMFHNNMLFDPLEFQGPQQGIVNKYRNRLGS